MKILALFSSIKTGGSNKLFPDVENVTFLQENFGIVFKHKKVLKNQQKTVCLGMKTIWVLLGSTPSPHLLSIFKL